MSVDDIIIAPDDRPGLSGAHGTPKPRAMPKLHRSTKTETQQPKPKARRKPRRPPLLSPVQKIAALGVGVVAVLTGGLVVWHSGAPQRMAAEIADKVWSVSALAGFSVTDISVQGRERTAPEDILAALATGTGSPILAVDLSEAKARLEAIASVRSAGIERHLPHTLRVVLIERRPVALWQHDGDFMLVDKDGYQIPGPIDGFETLPLVVGDGAPIATPDLFALLAREPAIGARVKAAVRVGSRRWNLRLDDAVKGLEVRLPEDNPEAALHHLADLEKDRSLSGRRVTMVDLRVSDRLVVKTGQDQTSPPDQASKVPENTPHSHGEGG